MTLSVFAFVDNGGGQSLFVRLALENLLLNGPRRNEPVHETFKGIRKDTWNQVGERTFFLLPVTPNTGQGLLICRWIPVYSVQVRMEGILHRCSIPGSNSMSLFAPIKLIPQPPALELSKKMNSLLSGLLN